MGLEDNSLSEGKKENASDHPHVVIGSFVLTRTRYTSYTSQDSVVVVATFCPSPHGRIATNLDFHNGEILVKRVSFFVVIVPNKRTGKQNFSRWFQCLWKVRVEDQSILVLLMTTSYILHKQGRTILRPDNGQTETTGPH
jgi:hypothetical protein